MNNQLPLNPDQPTVKVAMLLSGLVALSIVLPIRTNALISVTVLVIFFVYAIIKKSKTGFFFKTPLFILISIHLVIQLLGLLHSENLEQGYADIERYYFALLLPFFIYLTRSTGVTSSNLLSAFSFGTIGLTLFGIGYSIFFLEGEQQKNAFELGHTYFSNSIFIHPSYLSIYLTFIFFYLLETVRTKFSDLNKVKLTGLFLLLVYIVGMLFFLRSQMGLLIFVLLCMLYIIIIYKKRAWLITFMLFTVFLIVFLLDKNRISTFFDTYGKNVSSALDNRFKVWGGAKQAIKSAPIFGSGTGDEQIVLNEGYLKKGYQEGIDNSYNAHNQYLQFWIRNGVIELVAFITLMVYSFRQSLKTSNCTFLMFNILFTLSMLTESCLSVHKGIVFFYFFLSVFIFLPSESKPQEAKA